MQKKNFIYWALVDKNGTMNQKSNRLPIFFSRATARIQKMNYQKIIKVQVMKI